MRELLLMMWCCVLQTTHVEMSDGDANHVEMRYGDRFKPLD